MSRSRFPSPETDDIKKAQALLQELESQAHTLRTALSNLDFMASASKNLVEIESGDHLRQLLKERMEEDSIESSLLSLQTEIPGRTLSRIIKDPDSAKFGNLHSIATELGLKICIVK
ncbi:hypothetical protein [Ferrimonas marina]|uniref:Uncharacterized protein n=1 Tax=Ferrimonas marina TaxID=299255 RepID=A0A1M5TSC7_9GAMM|nr:hypothetical protein [Ferrimonas marina]SHH53516.1 hypothetical protein SAMN02745129_2255 [Ferrimonas marina]